MLNKDDKVIFGIRKTCISLWNCHDPDFLFKDRTDLVINTQVYQFEELSDDEINFYIQSIINTSVRRANGEIYDNKIWLHNEDLKMRKKDLFQFFLQFDNIFELSL